MDDFHKAGNASWDAWRHDFVARARQRLRVNLRRVLGEAEPTWAEMEAEAEIDERCEEDDQETRRRTIPWLSADERRKA